MAAIELDGLERHYGERVALEGVSVRVEEGQSLITDGPFAETKEQLAGYYILDCQDLDEALAWAAKIPTACAGAPGCIEIRPIREFSTRPPVNA